MNKSEAVVNAARKLLDDVKRRYKKQGEPFEFTCPYMKKLSESIRELDEK